LIIVFFGQIVLFCSKSEAGTAAKPRIVDNSEPGVWDADHSKRVELVPDLIIGKEDGDPTSIFGRIYDIAVGPEGDIYVLDAGYGHVQRFDSSGVYKQTIGGEGEGPGEFSNPTAVNVDDFGCLWVASRDRVGLFDQRGIPINDFRHGILSNLVRSIRVIREDGIYLSCFEMYDQLIIHKYDFEGAKVLSFCDSYAKGRDIDVRIENTFAGGALDVRDSLIYFTQAMPYEVRMFSLEGELLAILRRKNDFMRTPMEETNSDGTVSLIAGAYSFSIVVLNDGTFVNTVIVPASAEEDTDTILDFYDNEGRLLLTKRIDGLLAIKCTDDHSRLYAIDTEQYPRVVRYRIDVR